MSFRFTRRIPASQFRFTSPDDRFPASGNRFSGPGSSEWFGFRSRDDSPDSFLDSDADSDADSDDNHYLDQEHHYLVSINPEPDYDELLFRLSRYAFDRLSPRDQEQVEKLCRLNVELDGVLDIVEEQGPEESEEAFRRRAFAKLFKKLSYSDQLERVLSKVIEKFKRERQLEGDQDEESSSDRKSCFAEFFFGFSKIWFEGQSKRSQDTLIQQLSREDRGVTLKGRHADESEEDFKLREFTELCKKVADFEVQDGFLHFAEKKLRDWQHWSSDSLRLVGEQQDPDSAAHLLSHLSTFGYSRLSAKHQQSLIECLSKQVKFESIRAADITDDQEDIGVKTFTKLFYQVRDSTRLKIFREMRTILLKQSCRSEAVIRFFMESCSCQDQNEIMDALARLRSPTKPVIEKFSDESKEDFRLRKFTKLYMERDYALGYWDIPEKYAEFLKQVQEGTFDYKDECPAYAEFLFDVSTAWFKTRCANYWRNPIHVILFGNVDNHDVIEKLPEESEEEFRLRRFVESFKGLEFKSQERIVKYIEDAFIDLDLKFNLELYKKWDLARALRRTRRLYGPNAAGRSKVYEESPGPFDSKWYNMEEIQPDQGAGANSTGGAAATITPGAAAGTGAVGSATTTQAAANITPGAAAGTGAVGSATPTQAGGGTRQAGTSRP